jgi:hypothetical protein
MSAAPVNGNVGPPFCRKWIASSIFWGTVSRLRRTAALLRLPGGLCGMRQRIIHAIWVVTEEIKLLHIESYWHTIPFCDKMFQCEISLGFSLRCHMNTTLTIV